MPMLPWALIERELRVGVRKYRPVQSRLKVAALATAGAALLLAVGSWSGRRNVGQTLEQLVCLFGLYAVLRVPGVTAGVLAEERRNRTLGLLFLSGMSAGDVFVGKFLSAILVAFTNLLAIFPLLALPFLVGGISFDVFTATVCALPLLMLFTISVSLLASATTVEDGTAVVATFGLVGLLCALTPGIYLAQNYFAPGSNPSTFWLQLSPAYGPFLLWTSLRSGFGPAEGAAFWQNLSVTGGWTFLALALASLAVTRLWREHQLSSTGLRQRWRAFMHGSRERRQNVAQTWLAVNPAVWLAARDRAHAMLAWMVIGGIVLVWLSGWVLWPARWPSIPNFFITATVLNAALAWLTRYAAAHEIGQARFEGAYELLLTTPLNPKEIVEGTLEALLLKFRSLVNLVLAFNLLMMLIGLALRDWDNRSLAVYLTVWVYLMSWTWSMGHWPSSFLPVMWTSLNCGRPAFSVWRTSGFNSWAWLWLLFHAQNMGRQIPQFPTGSTVEIAVVLFVGLYWFVWLVRVLFSAGLRKWDARPSSWIRPVAKIDRTRLVRDFRFVVQQPLPDPTDPRYKKWDVRERFPWEK